MTIFNFGSINIDLFYTVPHFPDAGETLTTLSHQRTLGGKGANQSIALAKAGAKVIHIGAINADDAWIRSEMQAVGVDTSQIQDSALATGHAIVAVNSDGENQIMLCPSANRDITMEAALAVLKTAGTDDWVLLQNETNGAKEFAEAARQQGLKLAYSAAPFEAKIVLELLPHTDLLVVNEGEAKALETTLGKPASETGLAHLVITRGGDGAEYFGEAGHLHQPAFDVDVVDTTGAGDCFFGYLLAAIADEPITDESLAGALASASAAAALQITAAGASLAIPHRSEVDAFLESHRTKTS